MKKIIFTMLVILTVAGCSKTNETYTRQVTASELESGTGTYVYSKTYEDIYMVFKQGRMTCFKDKGIKNIEFGPKMDYNIKGDSIFFIYNHWGKKTHYSGHIEIIHIDSKEKTEDVLFINGENLPPLMGRVGYYKKSTISFKILL